MTISKLSVVLAIVLMTIAVGRVEAGPIQLRASGSFLTQGTPIDPNGDGRRADLLIVSGTSS